jgi:uncharacterized DUF497 family protein
LSDDRFEWDEHNEPKVLAHGVSPDEAEAVFADPDRVLRHAHRGDNGEHRYSAVGSDDGGRVLIVVFVKRGNRIRVVTARPASEPERRQYWR